MKIARLFSAGSWFHFDRESMKRTTEKLCFYEILPSAVRFTDSSNQHAQIPPMNRWATIIRRLRRLLQQSPPDEFSAYFARSVVIFSPHQELAAVLPGFPTSP